MKRDVSVILLFNTDKKILFQLRAKDALNLPGYWAFFGGGIDKDETPEQAVVREAQEELGYILSQPRLVMTQPFLRDAGDTENSFKYVFMELYDPSQTLVLGEGEAMDWFSIEETAQLQMSEHDRVALKQIQGKF